MSADSKDIEGVISQHGSEIESEVSTNDTALAERLDKVELLIEDVGKSSALVNELSEYISDLRGELTSIKRIRFWTIVLSVLFLVLLICTLANAFWFSGTWFSTQKENFQVAFVVSTLTASVVILSILLKGAFRSLADRHQDDAFPPNLKEMISALKLITGK